MAYFINQIQDSAEKERAWQRYHNIVDFVESKRCRHRQICLHFGETPKWTSCESCDVCGGTPEWLREPVMDMGKGRARSDISAGPSIRAVAKSGSREDVRAAKIARSSAEVDPELREYLREWRRNAAKEQKVAAFVVMHDSSLDELCRRKPKTIAELLGISGFGVKKAETYGLKIIEALGRFRDGARASVPIEQEKMSRPAEETIRLLAEGKNFEEIAAIRNRQLASVISLVADLIEQERLDFQPQWVEESKRHKIEAACVRLGLKGLRPLKDALPEEITFDEIRLVVACLRRTQDHKIAAGTVA